MRRSYIAVALVAWLIGFFGVLYFSGCTPVTSKLANITAPTGTDIDKAGSFVTSAEAAVTAAKPHADAVGGADLALASTAHKSALSSLDQAKVDLAKVQEAYRIAHDMLVKSQAQYTALLHSWGHVLQVWVEWAFWVLVVLVAIHFICIALTYALPPAYAPIAALVGKIVNPLGWTTWLLTWIEGNIAANTTPAGVVAKTG